MSDSRPGEQGADTGADASVHGLLVQAPIAPLDENGIVVTTVGTAAFVIAAAILGLQYDRLAASGDGWWFWVAVAGVVLGLIGLSYCWLRRSRQLVDR
jgi:hypothetical protein